MASINQAITTASGRVKWATSAPKRAATRYFGGEKKTWLVYWGLALGVFVVFMYVMVLGVNQVRSPIDL